MFDAKSLTEDQVSQLHAWAEDGDDLAKLQEKLNSELGIKVTYMEMRFVAEDLKIEIKVEEPEPEPEPEDEASAEDGAEVEADAIPEGEPIEFAGDPNQVTVTISKLQRPGTIVSGTAVFGGSESVEWWMDNMGQLGMDPQNKSFKPSQEQQMAFQRELQDAAAKEGL